MREYWKFAAQIVATALAGLVAALGDNHISTAEWLNVLVLALGAVGVIGAGNLPAGVWSYTKTYVAAATAGAVFLQSAITGGITGAEWAQFALAALGAVGVAALPGPRVYDADTYGKHAAGLKEGPA